MTGQRLLAGLLGALLLGLCAACGSAGAPPAPAVQGPALTGEGDAPVPTGQGTTATPPLSAPTTPPATGPAASPAPAPEARRGVRAGSARVRFVPERLELPDGSGAPVRAATTRQGELEVPEDVDHVGWWDGSAAAGDPFGTTVLAGHIDSAEQGLGVFTALLTIQEGDLVTVSAGDRQLTYRVVSTELVDKDALATGTDAFDQEGPHRLVLITCSGRWRPEVGSYESNVVVVAEPVDQG